MLKLVFLWLISFCPLLFYGQERAVISDDWQLPSGTLFYGLNIGVYMPNHATANYYNGTSSVNNLEDMIGGNPYAGVLNGYVNTNYSTIKERLNGVDYRIDALPRAMRYDKPACIGFHANYLFTPKSSLYLDMNYASLTTIDFFTLYLYNAPEGSINTSSYRVYPMKGIENRVDMTIGWMTYLYTTTRLKPFFDIGFNLNNTKVKSAEVEIEGLKISYLNVDNQYYNTPDYGVGYGMNGGGGLLYILQPSFSVSAGLTLSYKKINLGENQDFALNNYIYTRLLFTKLPFID